MPLRSIEEFRLEGKVIFRLGVFDEFRNPIIEPVRHLRGPSHQGDLVGRLDHADPSDEGGDVDDLSVGEDPQIGFIHLDRKDIQFHPQQTGAFTVELVNIGGDLGKAGEGEDLLDAGVLHCPFQTPPDHEQGRPRGWHPEVGVLIRSGEIVEVHLLDDQCPVDAVQYERSLKALHPFRDLCGCG